MGEATAIQREMFQAVANRDLEALRAMYHPDYTYTGPDGVEVTGPDAGIAVAETYTAAFPDLSVEFLAQHSSGDTAVAELLISGTHQEALEGRAATGVHVTMHDCNIVQVRDGRIVRERDYFDTATLLAQLGG
jgi:steroid delta-isomerase-like uncharacterized protein